MPIIVIVTGECLINYLLNHPQLIKKSSFLPLFRRYTYTYCAPHKSESRDSISIEERQDIKLNYIYVPGKHNFNSFEYSFPMQLNFKGLRDDSESFVQPEIVILGDSQSLGWGVEDSKNYASLLEKTTQMKTLNLSINGIGSARSMYLLKSQPGIANAKHIIIQYNEKKLYENYNLANDGTLYEPNACRFDQTSDPKNKLSVYYPGKHIFTLFNLWQKGKSEDLQFPQIGYIEKTKKTSAVSEAAAFCRILSLEINLIKHAKIYLIEINGYNRNDSEFITAVKKQIQQNKNFANLKNLKIYFINTSKILTDGDYYILDEHLNESGHRKIADLLKSKILQAL